MASHTPLDSESRSKFVCIEKLKHLGKSGPQQRNLPIFSLNLGSQCGMEGVKLDNYVEDKKVLTGCVQ